MDLYLDPDTNDLGLSVGGDSRLTSGILETTAQQLRIALRLFLGEWFLNRRIGVPYYRDVFVKNPKVDLVRVLFRRCILANANVEAVSRLDLDYDPGARTLVVDFEAILVDGTILVDSVSGNTDVTESDTPIGALIDEFGAFILDEFDAYVVED